MVNSTTASEVKVAPVTKKNANASAASTTHLPFIARLPFRALSNMPSRGRQRLHQCARRLARSAA